MSISPSPEPQPCPSPSAYNPSHIPLSLSPEPQLCPPLPAQNPNHVLLSPSPETTQLHKPLNPTLSGGMNPESPSVLSATRPLGRIVSQVMLPLLRPILSQPSGGNCRALGEAE
ncbi:hypothetical protein JZ751_023535 [Albula glossodonta]|uniref:Uncharacterized protein n=1 Tax=Albula glossodonta TaxID=121402 RepID=A0A8T2NGC2_9TELE|nr:hypothetical protein JZ751_023535 [Albula glossodonta]